MEGVWRGWPEVIVRNVASRFDRHEEEIRRVAVMTQGVIAAALVRVAAGHRGRERLMQVLEDAHFEEWAREAVRALPACAECGEECDEIRRRASLALDHIFEADRLALTEFFIEESGLSAKVVSHIFSFSLLFVLASLPPAERAGDSLADSLVFRIRREWECVESRLNSRERDFLENTLRVRRRSFDTGGYPAIPEPIAPTRSSLPPPPESLSIPRGTFSYIRELLGIAPKQVLRDDTEEG